MPKSVLLKNKKSTFIFSFIVAAVLSICCTIDIADPDLDMLLWGNKCLTESYDDSVVPNLKKYEISLTGNSFIRLRKTYQNNKQEYFSFQLHELDSVSYAGDTNAGTLELKAKADDIIVQTYNDKEGNVDSMANVLNLPVRNMPPEKLDSLKQVLNYYKHKYL